MKQEHDDGYYAAVAGRSMSGRTWLGGSHGGDGAACDWDGGEVALLHGRDVATGDDRSGRRGGSGTTVTRLDRCMAVIGW